MFGVFRSLFRPIANIGQKLGRLLSMGSKSPVIIEKVIETGKPIGKFMKVPMNVGADAMTSGGGFVSAGTQAVRNMADLPRYTRPLTELDFGTRNMADIMRGFN